MSRLDRKGEIYRLITSISSRISKLVLIIWIKLFPLIEWFTLDIYKRNNMTQSWLTIQLFKRKLKREYHLHLEPELLNRKKRNFIYQTLGILTQEVITIHQQTREDWVKIRYTLTRSHWSRMRMSEKSQTTTHHQKDFIINCHIRSLKNEIQLIFLGKAQQHELYRGRMKTSIWSHMIKSVCHR